jgi:DNA mismatch endonuclease (patch repair protein)
MTSRSRQYIRDGRAPIPINESTSLCMSANKAKNTKPELILRKALWNSNLRGYRVHVKEIPGKPDICFRKYKLAIFVNGCFWHRCEKCNPPIPRTNTDFWQKKFEANRERDNRKIQELIKLGWRVKVVWECEINKDLYCVIKEISDLLNQYRISHGGNFESC